MVAGARVVILGDDRGPVRVEQLDVGVVDVSIASADDGPEVVGGARAEVDLKQLTGGLLDMAADGAHVRYEHNLVVT
jgi:hypothetical protein